MSRKNFYKGQNVAPEDLNALQDYSEKVQADFLFNAFGSGLIKGLMVSYVAGFEIGISSGVGISPIGEVHILKESIRMSVKEHAPEDTGFVQKTVYLVSEIEYEQSEPATNIDGETVYTKLTPTLTISCKDTAEAHHFVLAEISMIPYNISKINHVQEYLFPSLVEG